MPEVKDWNQGVIEEFRKNGGRWRVSATSPFCCCATAARRPVSSE